MRKNTWQAFREVFLILLACLGPLILYSLYRLLSFDSLTLNSVTRFFINILFSISLIIAYIVFMAAIMVRKELFEEIKNSIKIDYYLRKGDASQVLALVHLEVRDQWTVETLVIKRLFNMKALNELWELFKLREYDSRELLSNCIIELETDKDKLIKLFNLFSQRKPYYIASTKSQEKVLIKLIDLQYYEVIIDLFVKIKNKQSRYIKAIQDMETYTQKKRGTV